MRMPNTIQSFLDLPRTLGRPRGRAPYIPQVDGLRFLAILVVFIWHSSLRADRYVERLSAHGVHTASLNPYMLHGEVGVDLFFFISGLVIAQAFLLSTRAWTFRDFYAKRFIRIYPPYLIALLGCYLILAVSGHKPEGASSFSQSSLSLSASFAASALYLHGLVYNVASRLNPPMWSLEIEIQFYLLVPFFMLGYLRVRSQRARMLLLGGLGAALIAGMAWLHGVYPFDNRYRLGLPVYAPYFLAGIATADLSTPGSVLARIKPGRLYDAALLAGLLLLGGIGLWFNRIDAHPQGFAANVLAPLLGLPAAFLIYHGALHGAVGRRVFGLPWFALIGTMCYSIYLTHIVVVQAVAEELLGRVPLHNPWLIWGVWMPVLAAAVFLLALVFYALVERPLMGGGPWFRKRPKAVPAPLASPIASGAEQG